MTRHLLYLCYLVTVVATISLSGCKKPLILSNGHLEFSQDTIVFDTVFTTVGSVTKKLKIYNKDSKTLTIDRIQLVGGANSPFRINVDGVPGTDFAGIELEGNDSLYIFIEVTVDPNNATNPLVIEDQILFSTNGSDQYVQLVAWGQDAYFHKYEILAPGTWPNDKPHVIYGYAAVDSAETLNIQAGTDIYLHKNAILYVYKGVLNINGTFGNEVTFQGDRLESFYDDVPGQYYGIYFREAQPSTINYAIIKNGTSGIHAYSEDPGNGGAYTVDVKNTTIMNCASYGVFIYAGAKVKAENCVVAKNGIHSLLVLEGGDFNFNNCTLVGYGDGDVGAAVGISNYYTRPDDNGIPTTFVGNINEGVISNSIVFGYGDQEISIDTLQPGGVAINFDFRYNHIKADPTPTASFYTNNTFNADPLFVNIENSDFKFWWTASNPVLNTADPATVTATDLEGYSRTADFVGPDKGAYEYH